MPPPHHQQPPNRPQTGPHETKRSRSAVTINTLMAQHSRDADTSDTSGPPTSEVERQRPRLLGLPKVIPDLQSACTTIGRGGNDNLGGGGGGGMGGGGSSVGGGGSDIESTNSDSSR